MHFSINFKFIGLLIIARLTYQVNDISNAKPLQKPKPCTKSYSGIRKKLTGRTPTDLTEAEIKGRDNRPITSKTALSTHIVDKAVINS
jgi:hypothetical protein